MGIDFINEATMKAYKESIKAIFKSAAKKTGDTPQKFGSSGCCVGTELLERLPIGLRLAG